MTDIEEPVQKLVKSDDLYAHEITPFNFYSPKYYRSSLILSKGHHLYGISHDNINIILSKDTPYKLNNLNGLNFSKLSDKKWIIGFDTGLDEQTKNYSHSQVYDNFIVIINTIETFYKKHIKKTTSDFESYQIKTPTYYQVFLHLPYGHRFYGMNYTYINENIPDILPYHLSYSAGSNDKWTIGFNTAPKEDKTKFYTYEEVCDFIRELSSVL